MELSLAVLRDEGTTSDVAVRVPAGGLVRDLTEALAGHVGMDRPAGGSWVLYSHRTSAWLQDTDTVERAGLLVGDIVSVVPAAGPAVVPPTARDAVADAVVRLRHTAGPRTGTEVLLGPGDHVLGRGQGVAVHLDDPYVAPEHARLSVAAGRVLLTDLGSPGGTALDGEPVVGSRAVRHGQIVRIGGAAIAIDRLQDAGSTGAVRGRVLFNRPPRVLVPAPPTDHRLVAPPPEPGRPRLPLAAALLPLLLGGVMLIFYRSALMVLFLAMSPVLAIGSYVEGRMGARGDYRRSRQRFLAAVSDLASELHAATSDEVQRRVAESPDLRSLALAAHRRDPRLWERRPMDDDFLRLRLALADLPSRHQLAVADGGSEKLRAIADGALDRYKVVRGVPLTASLAELGSAGLAGPREPVLGCARWLLLQVATLHSPRNLSICAAVPREDVAEWDWMKWLPHTSASTAQFDGPALCSDIATARELLERLIALMEVRAAAVGPFRGTATRAPFPYVVVLIHEDLPLPRSAITRLLAEGPRVGIVVLWVGSAARDLPNECGCVVEVDAGQRLSLTIPADGSVTHGNGRGDTATVAEARQVAMELAPLRDAAAGDARSQLPREVGLVELLGLPADPGGQEISAIWSNARGGIAAPLGAASTGPFWVDLRRDGPHALVGGTTGAGKSELLQTLVVSLAVNHPPARLTFLLVDYKGGAAFKDAAALPHVVGTVTDLDDHLAHRALVSLGAELRRREVILRDAGARDMVELERRNPGGAPPSLAIVVDEFATLVKDVPEFVDGVVDLAQRGRSLGLHLVLATQRPAGAINDNIRANTNMRICLRMRDEADSNDVIGVPDAAHIPAVGFPGRGFARTGHQELTELQVAYAGATVGGTTGGHAFQVVAHGFAGPAFRAGTGGISAQEGDTDLCRLVRAVRQAHAAVGDDDPVRPWLRELPSVLPAGDAAATALGQGLEIGLIDQPELQAQSPWILDLGRDGNMLVFGTSGSGKTSLLRTIATGLAVGSTPDELNLYAIDCGAGGLAPLGELPHCGAYIRGDETERMARFTRWLRADIDRRRAARAAMGGVGAEGGRPDIVVLLDNYSGFLSSMEKVDLGEHVDALPRLMADGPAVGVYFLATADRRAAVPSAVSALVSNRVVLRMADADEFRNAGVATDAFAGARLVPGRGFIGAGTEVQAAVLGRSGDAAEQAGAIRQAAAALRERFPGARVPRVELLPTSIDMVSLPAPSLPWIATLGCRDADLEVAELDLRDDGALVAGPRGSGRSNALQVALSSMGAGTPALRAILLSPRKSALYGMAGWVDAARGVSECERLAAALATRVQEAPEEDGPSLLVVIDDGEELLDGAAGSQLELLARFGRDRGVRVLGAVETGAAHRAYGGWVKEIRKVRRGLVLQPDVDIDGDLFGVRLPRRSGRLFGKGRGFVVSAGVAELVQVAAFTAT